MNVNQMNYGVVFSVKIPNLKFQILKRMRQTGALLQDIYRSGELAYVTLALVPDVLRLNELKELIEGERIRVPLFKIKDEFLPKYY